MKTVCKTFALAAGLMIAAGATAQDDTDMSRDDYRAEQERIERLHRSAQRDCRELSGNEKDVCLVEADQKRNVRQAELEAEFRPSAKADYDVDIAKAEAEFAIAKEKCDDERRRDREACVEDARKALEAARREAREEYREARRDDDRGSRQARRDRDDDRYARAKEQCEALSGDARERCRREAREQYR